MLLVYEYTFQCMLSIKCSNSLLIFVDRTFISASDLSNINIVSIHTFRNVRFILRIIMHICVPISCSEKNDTCLSNLYIHHTHDVSITANPASKLIKKCHKSIIYYKKQPTQVYAALMLCDSSECELSCGTSMRPSRLLLLRRVYLFSQYVFNSLEWSL